MIIHTFPGFVRAYATGRHMGALGEESPRPRGFVSLGGRSLIRVLDLDSADAFLACRQHQAEWIILGNLELLGREIQKPALGQKVGKEGVQACRVVGFFTQWKRDRDRNCTRRFKPLRIVLEPSASAGDFLYGTDPPTSQADDAAPEFHDLLSLPLGASTQPSILPKTANTAFTASVRSVSLPRSSSDTMGVPVAALLTATYSRSARHSSGRPMTKRGIAPPLLKGFRAMRTRSDTSFRQSLARGFKFAGSSRWCADGVECPVAALGCGNFGKEMPQVGLGSTWRPSHPNRFQNNACYAFGGPSPQAGVTELGAAPPAG